MAHRLVRLDLEHQEYLIDEKIKGLDKMIRDEHGHNFRTAHDLVSGELYVHVAHVIPDEDAEGRASKRRKKILKLSQSESFVHIPGQGYWMHLEDLKAFEDAVKRGLDAEADSDDENDDDENK